MITLRQVIKAFKELRSKLSTKVYKEPKPEPSAIALVSRGLKRKFSPRKFRKICDGVFDEETCKIIYEFLPHRKVHHFKAFLPLQSWSTQEASRKECKAKIQIAQLF